MQAPVQGTLPRFFMGKVLSGFQATPMHGLHATIRSSTSNSGYVYAFGTSLADNYCIQHRFLDEAPHLGKRDGAWTWSCGPCSTTRFDHIIRRMWRGSRPSDLKILTAVSQRNRRLLSFTGYAPYCLLRVYFSSDLTCQCYR